MLLLNEQLGMAKVAAFAAIVVGVYLICAFEQTLSGTRLGMVFAMLGGLGYALFLVASKYLRVGSGIAQLVWLFGCGTVYLLLPALHGGFVMPGWKAWIAIVALVLLPTIGGFYFTTKAVQHGEASKVQIIETSDPIFATLLGFVAFGDVLSRPGLLGGVFILGRAIAGTPAISA